MASFYGPRTRKVAVAVINERRETGGSEAIFKPPSPLFPTTGKQTVEKRHLRTIHT